MQRKSIENSKHRFQYTNNIDIIEIKTVYTFCLRNNLIMDSSNYCLILDDIKPHNVHYGFFITVESLLDLHSGAHINCEENFLTTAKMTADYGMTRYVHKSFAKWLFLVWWMYSIFHSKIVMTQYVNFCKIKSEICWFDSLIVFAVKKASFKKSTQVNAKTENIMPKWTKYIRNQVYSRLCRAWHSHIALQPQAVAHFHRVTYEKVDSNRYRLFKDCCCHTLHSNW